MRVLHVIPSVSPKRGGPSLAVLAMVRALRARGVDAEIATTTDDGEGVLDVPVEQLTEREGVPVRYFDRWSPPLRAVREFAYSRPLADWLARFIRDYDLLHVHAIFSYPSTQAMRVARAQAVPYINRPLGQLCQWAIRHRGWKKRLYLYLAERANLSGAAGVHFTTEQERTEANVVEPGLPGFVIPHGVSAAALIPEARPRLRAMLQLPADEPVILFLGRIHPVKGLELLIPALSRLAAERFTFALVGDADSLAYEAQVQALLAASGLTARTRRLPFATGEQKQILLQGADLFVLTSHSENFGLAVVEAMAAGLPVVVTPGVGLAELVARHQLGEVAPMEVAGIAAALRKQLAQPNRRIEIGCAARQLVEVAYSWPAIAKRLMHEYSRAILNHPSVSSLP